MSCAVRVGFSPRGARAIQYAVASATDDDKAVKPLGKQILEVFSCRSNKCEEKTYQAINVSTHTGSGDAWFTYHIVSPNGHTFICSVAAVSQSKIRLQIENMKSLFIRQYNELHDTLTNGIKDMVGVNKVKSYVMEWLHGKGINLLNKAGKNWMDQFGDRVEDLETLSNDLTSLKSVDFSYALPKNIISKVTSYQNSIVKYISDVLGMGEL